MPSGLGVRTLSSVVVVLVAALLVYGPFPLLVLTLLLLATIGVLEMYALLSPALPAWLGVALATLLILAAAPAAGPAGGRYLGLAVFLCLAAPLVWAMLQGVRSGGLALWALAAAGALYVGWPLAHVELLRSLPNGQGWLIFAITCTWAADTGAYFAGSLFGSRKLAPRISPGKTVEGSVGAVALSLLAGVLVGWLAGVPLSVLGLAVTALFLSVVAQAGDLAESYVKRVAGAKDSGHLIPGHGGLLDRIDGLLWVVVATYYLAAAVL